MKFARQASSLNTSYIREILKAAVQPDMISMAGGLPASSLLPVGLVGEACASLADDADLFQYGNSQGYQPLLETLSQQYAEYTNPWLICNGSQQGLDLIARSLLEQGDGVVVEVPAYLGALQVFHMSGASIYPLNTIVTGPNLNQLETYFKNDSIKLFYAVPDFHNPTGRVWSAETRIAVAEMCRRYDVTLIEDSPYRELRFSGEQHLSLSALYPEQTISLKSFSKTGFPGLRVGAINGPREFITLAERLKQATDLHTGIPQQMIIDRLINHPDYPMHLSALRSGYKDQYERLNYELTMQLKDKITFDDVEGGMFIWITLNEGKGSEIASKALKQRLAVVPGIAFYPTESATEDNAIRLNFSNTPPELFTEAIARLVRSF